MDDGEEDGSHPITMNDARARREKPKYIEKAVRERGPRCFKTARVEADEGDRQQRQEHEILDKAKDVEGVVRVIDAPDTLARARRPSLRLRA